MHPVQVSSCTRCRANGGAASMAWHVAHATQLTCASSGLWHARVASHSWCRRAYQPCSAGRSSRGTRLANCKKQGSASRHHGVVNVASGKQLGHPGPQLVPSPCATTCHRKHVTSPGTCGEATTHSICSAISSSCTGWHSARGCTGFGAPGGCVESGGEGLRLLQAGRQL